MADYFRAKDSSRLVHYEGVFNNREYDGISDVESRMYAKPQDIRDYLESKLEKPFILCEYMHDIGNSLGGMESHIRLGEEFPQYQGGFIWDYMDQALWFKNVNGQKVLGYGGDFGERQTDYAFSGNGIVFVDGFEKPAMQEVRYWYATSKERAAFDAEKQNALKAEELKEVRKQKPIRVVHGDGALGVHGDEFEALSSYPHGGPVSIKRQGKEWLWGAPRPAFWRAPTENDIGRGFDRRSAIWSAVEGSQKCENIEVLRESNTSVTIRYTYSAQAMLGLKTDVTYTVDGTGFMDVRCHYYGAENCPQFQIML